MSDDVKDTSADTIDAHVEAVKTQVEAEWAKAPFRAEPTWADIHAAIAAVVRYFVGPRPTVAPADVPPVDADPVTDRPSAEIIPLAPPAAADTPPADTPPTEPPQAA